MEMSKLAKRASCARLPTGLVLFFAKLQHVIDAKFELHHVKSSRRSLIRRHSVVYGLNVIDSTVGRIVGDSTVCKGIKIPQSTDK